MADIDATVYDFVYFLAAAFFSAWLIRQLFLFKSLHALSRSVSASSVVLLDEVRAVTQRVTTDAVTSILSKKKVVRIHPVEPLSLAASLNKAQLSTRDDTCELTVDVCTRLPCRVDVFLGVQRQLMSLMYNDFARFSSRPQRASIADRHKQVNKQITPSLVDGPSSTFLAPSETGHHSAQWQVDATPSTPVIFTLPKSAVEQAVNDPSCIPIVILLSPVATSAPPAGAPRRSGPSPGPPSTVELSAAASGKLVAAKREKWLASHPYPASTTLQSLTLLTATMESGATGDCALSVDGTLTLSSSPPGVLHCEECFGLLDEPDCLVCLSEPKDVILLPCRHCAVCEGCLAGFQQQKCPVCRAPLTDYCVFVRKDSDGHDAGNLQPAVPEEAKERCKEE